MAPAALFLRLAIAAATLSLAVPARAAGLGEGEARAFVAQQQRAWNAGDLDAYFGLFTSDAVFTDQYRTPGGAIVPYGTSALAKARAQARRFRASAKVSETAEVVRVSPAAGGQEAEVVSRVVSRTESAKGRRTACAERRQTLIVAGGRLRSKGQTDTFTRCPR